jgi:hypothetical protein
MRLAKDEQPDIPTSKELSAHGRSAVVDAIIKRSQAFPESGLEGKGRVSTLARQSDPTKSGGEQIALKLHQPM